MMWEHVLLECRPSEPQCATGGSALTSVMQNHSDVVCVKYNFRCDSHRLSTLNLDKLYDRIKLFLLLKNRIISCYSFLTVCHVVMRFLI